MKTVRVKEDDEKELTDWVHLGPAAQKTMDSLKMTKEKCFCFKEDEFGYLPYFNENIMDDSVQGAVNLNLTDPPYNIRFDQECENSDHEQFGEEDIGLFVELCGLVSSEGSPVHIFWLAMQFPLWVQNVNANMKFVPLDDSEHDESLVDVMTELRAFCVEETPLWYTNKRVSIIQIQENLVRLIYPLLKKLSKFY